MRILLGLLVLLAGLLPGVRPSLAQTSKSVTVALAHEPDRLYNPTTLAGQLAANLVFDPLVGLNDQMNPYPVLATTIPSPDNSLVRLSGDGADRRLIVTMPLRQDVTWSDGQPFTADDVVYTWQLMMNPQSGFDTTVEDKLKNVDKTDDFTVRFTYLSANEARALDPERYSGRGDQPVVDPLYLFGLYDAPAIYPRHKLRELVGDDPRHSRQMGSIETSAFARNPVGTGPYVLSSWEPGSALTFSSRGMALAHRLGMPALDTVVFQIMPDKNDSLTALTQDQVHVVAQDSLDAGDAPVLDTLPGVRARYTPGNAWEHLTFNLDNPILAEPTVRQAIALGINRPALNEAIMFGKAEVAISQVPSWSWAFDASMPHPEYDPTQASQILDRAGWARAGPDGIRAKNGQRLTLKFWSTPATFRPGLMALIKDQLAQTGVEVNIDSLPSATLFDTTANASTTCTPQAFRRRPTAFAGATTATTRTRATTSCLTNCNAAWIRASALPRSTRSRRSGSRTCPSCPSCCAQLPLPRARAWRISALPRPQPVRRGTSSSGISSPRPEACGSSSRSSCPWTCARRSGESGLKTAIATIAGPILR
ncbi:MAG: peptide ABC transporter substrate-binding protein [Chloroflexi bacterium]|nr:peptide ABC transporter substrate-binding protein [Chloroflexota bacterium]